MAGDSLHLVCLGCLTATEVKSEGDVARLLEVEAEKRHHRWAGPWLPGPVSVRRGAELAPGTWIGPQLRIVQDGVVEGGNWVDGTSVREWMARVLAMGKKTVAKARFGEY